MTAFGKIQVVLAHVDAAGRRHPVVYRATPHQHAAWETIARIQADVKAKTKGDE